MEREKGGSTFPVNKIVPTETQAPVKPESPPVLTKEGIKKTGGKKIALGVGGAALTISAVGAAIWGIKSASGSDSDSENPTAAASSEDVGSFPNSFNNDGSLPTLEGLPPNLEQPFASNPQSVSEPETKKVNPEGMFDNTATKGVITELNSVVMTPKQYQDTLPQLINGDSVVIPLPIELPKGQKPNLTFKRERGTMFGGKRLINGRLENGEVVSDGSVTVNDVLTIDGIPVGSALLFSFDGEAEIAFPTSSGYEQADGSLSLGSFFLYLKDANGNKATLTVSTVKIKPLVEPSPIEYQEGTNTTKPLTRRTIKSENPIGIILTEDKHPRFDGQIHISATSQVGGQNVQRRGGAAEIKIATSNGKAVRLEHGSEPK